MRLQEISSKMKTLAWFALPSKEYDPIKAEEYYKMQSLYWEEKNKRADTTPIVSKKNSDKFINGYGEATNREITSRTYKNQQKRLSKDMLNFIG